MSIAIKNESIGDSMGIFREGSPWGRGFAVGLSLALVILLPLFFVYALIDGPISDRINAAHRQESITTTRDFSSSQSSDFKNYLEK